MFATIIGLLFAFIVYILLQEFLEEKANGFSEETTRQIEKVRLMGEELKRMNKQELRERCYMGTQFIKEEEFKL